MKESIAKTLGTEHIAINKLPLLKNHYCWFALLNVDTDSEHAFSTPHDGPPHLAMRSRQYRTTAMRSPAMAVFP